MDLVSGTFEAKRTTLFVGFVFTCTALPFTDTGRSCPEGVAGQRHGAKLLPRSGHNQDRAQNESGKVECLILHETRSYSGAYHTLSGVTDPPDMHTVGVLLAADRYCERL